MLHKIVIVSIFCLKSRSTNLNNFYGAYQLKLDGFGFVWKHIFVFVISHTKQIQFLYSKQEASIHLVVYVLRPVHIWVNVSTKMSETGAMAKRELIVTAGNNGLKLNVTARRG